MAKKSRRIKSTSSSSLFAWPKVLVVIIPLFAAVLIMFNSSNGRSVLGVSDTNLLNLNHEQKSASNSGDTRTNHPKCKQNRVANFSVSTLCATGNGFKSFSYTCEDGVFATVTKTNCVNPQSAFEYSARACAKTSECFKLEASKKLSTTPNSNHAEPTRGERPNTGL